MNNTLKQLKEFFTYENENYDPRIGTVDSYMKDGAIIPSYGKICYTAKTVEGCIKVLPCDSYADSCIGYGHYYYCIVKGMRAWGDFRSVEQAIEAVHKKYKVIKEYRPIRFLKIRKIGFFFKRLFQLYKFF